MKLRWHSFWLAYHESAAKRYARKLDQSNPIKAFADPTYNERLERAYIHHDLKAENHRHEIWVAS